MTDHQLVGLALILLVLVPVIAAAIVSNTLDARKSSGETSVPAPAPMTERERRYHTSNQFGR